MNRIQRTSFADLREGGQRTSFADLRDVFFITKGSNAITLFEFCNLRALV